MSKSEVRKRPRVVSLRLNEEEWLRLETEAQASGLVRADYARAKLLGDPPLRAQRRPVPNAVLLSRILGNLGKVGSNVNQIAHLENSGRSWPDGLFTHVKEDIAAIREMLIRALGGSP